MTMAITKAAEEGATAVICASTGNTVGFGRRLRGPGRDALRGAHPRGQDRPGQARRRPSCTAREVVAIEGNFDLALELVVKEISARHPITLVNSVNPYRIEGQKTAAFEIVRRLGDAPAMLCIPVGNAGNITSYWKGFREYEAQGTAAAPAGDAGASRPRARTRWCGARWSPSPRRSPRPSASAIRPGERRPWPPRGSRGADPRRHRRGDPRGSAAAGQKEGRLLRAGLGGQYRRAAQVSGHGHTDRRHGGGRPDRPRPERPADRHRPVAPHRALPGGPSRPSSG